MMCKNLPDMYQHPTTFFFNIISSEKKHTDICQQKVLRSENQDELSSET